MLDAATAADCMMTGRIISLHGEVDAKMLEHLEKQAGIFRDARGNPVLVTLMTAGGDGEDALAIYSVLRLFAARSTVWLAAISRVQLTGIHVMMAIPKERRVAFPDTCFQVGLPEFRYEGFTDGGAADHEKAIAQYQSVVANHRDRCRRLLEKVAEGTGTELGTVSELFDKPCFLNTDEALKFGLISGVIT